MLLDGPWSAVHVGLGENNPVLGLPDKRSNYNGPEGWRKAQAADRVVCSMLGIGRSPEPRNSLVRSLEGLLVSHGRNARKPCYSVAEARGRRPRNPRWSPHFRTKLANAVCAPSGQGDDVRVRWSVDAELTDVGLVRVGALRRSDGDDSKYEVLKQSLKALSHPGIPPPNSLRFRRVDWNIDDYHLQMMARREKGKRERQKTPRCR